MTASGLVVGSGAGAGGVDDEDEVSYAFGPGESMGLNASCFLELNFFVAGSRLGYIWIDGVVQEFLYFKSWLDLDYIRIGDVEDDFDRDFSSGDWGTGALGTWTVYSGSVPPAGRIAMVSQGEGSSVRISGYDYGEIGHSDQYSARIYGYAGSPWSAGSLDMEVRFKLHGGGQDPPYLLDVPNAYVDLRITDYLPPTYDYTCDASWNAYAADGPGYGAWGTNEGYYYHNVSVFKDDWQRDACYTLKGTANRDGPGATAQLCGCEGELVVITGSAA